MCLIAIHPRPATMAAISASAVPLTAGAVSPSYTGGSAPVVVSMTSEVAASRFADSVLRQLSRETELGVYVYRRRGRLGRRHPGPW